MKHCQNCRAEVNPDDKFCTNCGMNLTKAFHCQNCRAEVNPDDKFCTNCGMNLKDTAQGIADSNNSEVVIMKSNNSFFKPRNLMIIFVLSLLVCLWMSFRASETRGLKIGLDVKSIEESEAIINEYEKQGYDPYFIQKSRETLEKEKEVRFFYTAISLLFGIVAFFSIIGGIGGFMKKNKT